jgi:hypothetical protein
MTLTACQRRKVNQANAAHSTGPTSVEGKEASRRNSLTHGLTAKALTLPNEDEADIQASADAWHDACQPQDHDEDVLVERLALASLQLGRITTAENGVIAEQVRKAEIEWDKAQKHQLLDAILTFRAEPARGVIELESFGAGVSWMRARWQELAEVFDVFHCWSDVSSLQQALRLLGYDPTQVGDEPGEAVQLCILVLSCLADRSVVPQLSAKLGFTLNVETLTAIDREMAAEAVRDRIGREVARLKALDDTLQAIDTDSRAGASDRATVPFDSAQNRLMLRYRKTASTDFDKSLRALQKRQSDRQKAAEKEAQEARNREFPNEPSVVGRTQSKRLEIGALVTINKMPYSLADKSDGNLLLCPYGWVPASCKTGVVRAPDEGV